MSDDGIRVNMSAKEGTSVTLTPVPAGKYSVAVTDNELVFTGPTSKKPGSPMFKMELTIQEGPFAGRKVWTNVMLFDGALYSLSQMLKAQNIAVTERGEAAEFQVPGYGANEVPGAAWWMGKTFLVRVAMSPARTVDGKTYDERNEVKGFMKLEGSDNTPAGKASSLLP